MKVIKERIQYIKTKKVIGRYKDELAGKIMTEFVAPRAKTYVYLVDDDSEHKKPREQTMRNKTRAYG